jgi:hypothetical protein
MTALHRVMQVSLAISRTTVGVRDETSLATLESARLAAMRNDWLSAE